MCLRRELKLARIHWVPHHQRDSRRFLFQGQILKWNDVDDSDSKREHLLGVEAAGR